MPLGNASLAKLIFLNTIVASYEEKFPWVVEIREGIEPVLSDVNQVKYFYRNTKVNHFESAGLPFSQRRQDRFLEMFA